MTTSRNHTETDAESPDSARGRLTVVLAAAILLLTVLSSLALSTTASAEVDPELVERPAAQPEIIDENLPLLPVPTSQLQATVTFPCEDDHTGAGVRVDVVNPSPSIEMGFSVEVTGPNGTRVSPPAGFKLPEVEAGGTYVVATDGGNNGDIIEVWARDAHENTFAYEQWTVDCGQPGPSVDFDVVCKHHDAYVVVTLGNDGLTPVGLDVYFVLASLQGADIMPATRTVNPGETQTIEYPVEIGETYSVRVFIQGKGDVPFAEETIIVDCYDEPTPPDPKPTPPEPKPTPPTYTPPPAGRGTPRFTG